MDASVATGRRGERIGEVPDAAPLLDPRGARLVLGVSTETGKLVEPIAPAADRLFGPRGAAIAGPAGPLVVCDTGHHRLLVWTRVPEKDGAPADLVIGQPGFGLEGRNARGDVGPTTLNVPTGVAIGAGILAVADAWNHRVLLWHGLPRLSNQPPDRVLGQADFRTGDPNRGLPEARADTLRWCYGVEIHAGRLFVADTGNRRVLVWDGIPTVNGAPADLVLGQHDFARRDDGAGAAPGAAGMRWPHAIAAEGDLLVVADAGYSRVMVWRGLPHRNGAGCDFVLGQAELGRCDHNRAADWPTAASMNMPHGVAMLSGSLIVADTANSRLLGFDTGRLAMGAAATLLAGQESFADKVENGPRLSSRCRLCWPYAVAACGRTLVIADSGNNRILLWESA